MNLIDNRLAEDNIIKASAMLDELMGLEEIMSNFNLIETREMAKFLKIKRYGNKNKTLLWNELLLRIKEYVQTISITFVGGFGEKPTYDPRKETNSFAFDIIYKGIKYRVVFKDGYPKAIERSCWRIDSWDTLFVENETANKLCEVVEGWFDNNENGAWWRRENA